MMATGVHRHEIERALAIAGQVGRLLALALLRRGFERGP